MISWHFEFTMLQSARYPKLMRMPGENAGYTTKKKPIHRSKIHSRDEGSLHQSAETMFEYKHLKVCRSLR